VTGLERSAGDGAGHDSFVAIAVGAFLAAAVHG
jgi:hypothetical protein